MANSNCMLCFWSPRNFCCVFSNYFSWCDFQKKPNQKPPLITKINIQIEYVKSVPSHSCEGTLWKYRNKSPHLNLFVVRFRANQLLRISKFLKMMSFGRLTLWRNEFVTLILTCLNISIFLIQGFSFKMGSYHSSWLGAHQRMRKIISCVMLDNEQITSSSRRVNEWLNMLT